MNSSPAHIYTLTSGIDQLGNSTSCRDLQGGRLYDGTKYPDYDCVKEIDIEEATYYSYKPPNGSVHIYTDDAGANTTTCTRRCHLWRSMIQKTVLTGSVILYALLGGVVFAHIETQEEDQHHAHVERWKNDTAILMATELRQVKPHEDLWARTVYHYLGLFEKDLMKAFRRGYRQPTDPIYGQQWTYGGALAFCISAMTGTVYGTAVPKSSAGRVLFPIYSVIGIPMTFVWLVMAGAVMADCWTFLVLRVCCCLTRPSTPRKICPLHPSEEKHHSFRSATGIPSSPMKATISRTVQNRPRSSAAGDIPRYGSGRSDRMQQETSSSSSHHHYQRASALQKQQHQPRPWPLVVETMVPNVEYQIVIVIFAILLFIVYFVVGTAIISLRTEWTFSESLSFTVLMLSTRGVGDFDPGLGESEGFAMALKRDMSMVFYYILGLCLLSTIASLLYRVLTFKRRRMCHSYA